MILVKRSFNYFAGLGKGFYPSFIPTSSPDYIQTI